MSLFNQLRRHVLLGALSVATASLLPGVASAQQGPGVTDKEIKIGSWTTLTGPIAVYGIPHRAGMEAYFNLVNDRGGIKGRKFNLIVEDNGFSSPRTVTAARKLVGSDNVLAIVHPLGTPQIAATFDYLLGEMKVPILVPQGSLTEWWTPPRENLYGALVAFESHARVMGRWLAKDGHKNVVVVHSALAAFESVAKDVPVGARTVRGDITMQLYPTKFGTTDYGPIALEIASKKPDAVVAILTSPETIALSKELRQQGSRTALYSYGPAVQVSFPELGGAAVEGLKAVSTVVPPATDTPAVREYREALAKYSPNEKPDYGSLFSFANAKIFAEVVRRIDGPINRAALIQSMHTLRDFETGILPPVTFSATRHLGTTSLQRVEVKGGKWIAVGGFVDAESNW